jgi:DNA-binding PadR family transcriptional regulator
MSTKTIYDYIVNKDNYHYETRKYITVDGKRLGYLEYLVLEFASKHALIQAAQVREYIRQEHGATYDLRRIHDSLQRLLRKGIVEKVSRGIYRLTEYGKKLLNTLLSQKARKESGFRAAGSYGDGGFGRYRLHVRNGGDLEDLVRQLYAVYRVARCVLGYFRRVLGKRCFYKVVRGVYVECIDFFVGGHGVSGVGRSRSLRRPLVDLGYFQSLGVKPLEIGVDVFAVVGGLGKPSVKIYFG